MPQPLVTTRGLWALLVLAALLLVLGAWWPTSGGGSARVDAQGASAVLIQPSGLPPMVSSVTIQAEHASAGTVMAADARSFLQGQSWLGWNGSDSERHQGQNVSPAAASDLWRNSPGTGEVTWSPQDGDALLAVTDGTAPLSVQVRWEGPGTRGNTWLRLLGLIALLAALLLAAGRIRRRRRLERTQQVGSAGSGPDAGGDDGDRDHHADRSGGERSDRDDGRAEGEPQPDQVSGPAPAGAPTVAGPMSPVPSGGGTHVRTAVLGAGAVIGTAGLLGACAGGGWLTAATTTPSASALSAVSAPGVLNGTSNGAKGLGYPAVTPVQAKRINATVDASLAAVEAAHDPAAAGGRLTGPATGMAAARSVIVKASGAGRIVPTALTTSRLGVPTATAWPRWFLVAGVGSGSSVPVMRVLHAETARSPYGLWAELSLLPGATVPAVAVGESGAAVLDPDVADLIMTPREVAIRYADVLNRGVKSDFAAAFAPDTFRTQLNERLRADREQIVATAIAGLTSTHTVDSAPILAVRTQEGGALVIVTLDQAYEVKIASGGRVKADPDLAALAGRGQFSNSLDRRAVEVLAFRVPPKGSSDPVALVAAIKGDLRASGS